MGTFLDAWDLGVSGRFPGLEARRSRQPMVVGALLDAEWIAQNKHSEIGLLMSRGHITLSITSVYSRTDPLGDELVYGFMRRLELDFWIYDNPSPFLTARALKSYGASLKGSLTAGNSYICK